MLQWRTRVRLALARNSGARLFEADLIPDPAGPIDLEHPSSYRCYTVRQMRGLFCVWYRSPHLCLLKPKYPLSPRSLLCELFSSAHSSTTYGYARNVCDDDIHGLTPESLSLALRSAFLLYWVPDRCLSPAIHSFVHRRQSPSSLPFCSRRSLQSYTLCSPAALATRTPLSIITSPRTPAFVSKPHRIDTPAPISERHIPCLDHPDNDLSHPSPLRVPPLILQDAWSHRR